jgi:hypothetical protein
MNNITAKIVTPTAQAALSEAALPQNQQLVARAILSLLVFAVIAIVSVRLPLAGYLVVPSALVAFFFCAKIYLLGVEKPAAGGEA